MAPIICVSSPLVPGPFLPAVGKQRGLSQRPAANRRLAGPQFQAPFSFPLQKTSGCSNIRGSTSPWIRVHTSLHVVLQGRHRAPQSVHMHLKRRLVPFPEIGNWFRGPLLYIHVSSFFRILNMAVAKSPQGFAHRVVRSQCADLSPNCPRMQLHLSPCALASPYVSVEFVIEPSYSTVFFCRRAFTVTLALAL